MLNRTARKAIGEETVAILKEKRYKSATGRVVDLAASLQSCLEGTHLIAADTPLPQPSKKEGGGFATVLEVTGETSLEACKRLCQQYTATDGTPARVMCLNFASAHNPGGGFTSGAGAQEESLARNSTLYASLTAHPELYKTNGAMKRGDPAAPHTVYTDTMLYSPNVLVFRDEKDGHLLDEPYPVSIISVPAPNAGATMNNFAKKMGVPEAQLLALVEAALRRRLERVLAASAQEDIGVLVLGAYGCGVFRNKVSSVIGIYRSLLYGSGPYAGVFRHVTFAVYAPKAGDMTFAQFKEQL